MHKKLLNKVLYFIIRFKDLSIYSLFISFLIIVFNTFMRTGSGVTTRCLMELTGAEYSQVDKVLKNLDTNGVVRKGTSGWMVAYDKSTTG